MAAQLAPQLPLPIPVPLAMGVPGEGYPCPGRSTGGSKARPQPSSASPTRPVCGRRSPDSSPPCSGSTPPAVRRPGEHNFFRGGPLAYMTARPGRRSPRWRARSTSTRCGGVGGGPGAAGRARGLVPRRRRRGNLLVRRPAERRHRLRHVRRRRSGLRPLLAWTFLSGDSRDAFRAALPLDDATWARGRGWALWKALITLGGSVTPTPPEAAKVPTVIAEILADHRRAG